MACYLEWKGKVSYTAAYYLSSGKVRLSKSWRTWNAPELISVSPLAVVAGKETSLVLRGRNLTVPGTK